MRTSRKKTPAELPEAPAIAGKTIAPATGHSGASPAVTLIAVVGISPAILTETVWALARPGDNTPPVLPDEVVAITTTAGRDKINAQLFTPSPEFEGRTVWQSLRFELLGENATHDTRLTLRVAVIEKPDPLSGQAVALADIRDPEDNLAAAEFILAQVRNRTASKDCRLIASLAGGRKTMGALLHAAFTHLARPQDRLTHILVNEPFDGPLQPLFFFPGQPTQMLKARDGQTFTALNARLELADVPFAALRTRFPDIAEIPTRFRDMVEMYGEAFKRDATKPALIELISDPPRVVVDGLSVELESSRQLNVIQFLLEANVRGWLGKNQDEALEIFKAWNGYTPQLDSVRTALKPAIEKLHADRTKRPGPDWIRKAIKDDIKRALSFWRKALEHAGSPWRPPQRDLRLPPFTLVKDS